MERIVTKHWYIQLRIATGTQKKKCLYAGEGCCNTVTKQRTVPTGSHWTCTNGRWKRSNTKKEKRTYHSTVKGTKLLCFSIKHKHHLVCTACWPRLIKELAMMPTQVTEFDYELMMKGLTDEHNE